MTSDGVRTLSGAQALSVPAGCCSRSAPPEPRSGGKLNEQDQQDAKLQGRRAPTFPLVAGTSGHAKYCARTGRKRAEPCRRLSPRTPCQQQRFSRRTFAFPGINATYVPKPTWQWLQQKYGVEWVIRRERNIPRALKYRANLERVAERAITEPTISRLVRRSPTMTLRPFIRRTPSARRPFFRRTPSSGRPAPRRRAATSSRGSPGRPSADDPDPHKLALHVAPRAGVAS